MNIEHIPHMLLPSSQYRTLERLTRIRLSLVHSLIDTYGGSITPTPHSEVVQLSKEVARVDTLIIEDVRLWFYAEDEGLVSANVPTGFHVEDAVYVSTEDFILWCLYQ